MCGCVCILTSADLVERDSLHSWASTREALPYMPPDCFHHRVCLCATDIKCNKERNRDSEREIETDTEIQRDCIHIQNLSLSLPRARLNIYKTSVCVSLSLSVVLVFLIHIHTQTSSLLLILCTLVCLRMPSSLRVWHAISMTSISLSVECVFTYSIPNWWNC